MHTQKTKLIEQALQTAAQYVQMVTFDGALTSSIITLGSALHIATHNASIYMREGNAQQAMCCIENAHSFRAALTILNSERPCAIFDKAEAESGLSLLDKLNLTTQLTAKCLELKNGDFTGTRLLDKISISTQITQLVAQLTGTAFQNIPASTSATIPSANEFAYDDATATPRVRQQRNDAALALLKQIESGEVSQPLNTEQRQVLSLYSGNGGGMVRSDGIRGSQFEYYTPKPIAAGMWDLLKSSGFSGGSVLDPCAGTGIFSATAPEAGIVMHSVELDSVSGGINKALFANGVNQVEVSNFEKVAASSNDELYDAVITNVPFGDNKARGKNKKDDARYQNESLEGYFILRSLDKLKPNGLAVFMSGTKFITGRSCEKLRILASYKAEFMGAYRLPNKLFDSAGADVITDVMVFKKHSIDAIAQIADLRDTDPAKLGDCGVLYDNFISGRYFSIDGAHFKLGESTVGTDRYGKEVEKLVSDASISEIGQALRKFGGSRIDWDMLGAQVGGSIAYQAGDSTIVNGQTVVFDGMSFAPVENSRTSESQALIEGMAQYASPSEVLENNIPYQTLLDGYMACESVGQYRTVPVWLHGYMQNTVARQLGATGFATMLTVAAYLEVKDQHAGAAGFNYLSQYPKLSNAIKTTAKTKFNDAVDCMSPSAQEAFKSMHSTVYSRKTGAFSAFWLGTVVAEVVIDARNFTPLQNYERLLYQKGSDYTKGLPIEQFTELMPNVNVLTDEAWCLSSDGTHVISAADYYSGTLEAFNLRTAMDLSQVSDDAVRSKLINQHNAVSSKLVKADVQAMSFDIRSPYTDDAQVLAFLQQFVSPYYRIKTATDELGNESSKFEYAPPAHAQSKTIGHYGKARLAVYLNNGSFSSGQKDEDANIAIRDELKKLIDTSNLQFDAYVHSNQAFMRDMDARINTPKTMRFKSAEGTGALHIDGMSDTITPHQYQADYVRQQARNMGGILAYDVGLGKTLTALATVKHLHNIGAKKKTLFVVPNTVLSNWRKEVKQAYTDMDDCLFIGLRTDKDGKPTVKSSDYAADLAQLSDNQYRKVFMTLEAFEKIPLQSVTLTEYIETYMSTVENLLDMTDNTEKAKNAMEDAQLKLRRDIESKMDQSVPYLETMGVDSIVMDEAHVFKNSRKGQIDAGGAVQFLSLPDTSSRGTNAQVKTWYIRGKNKPLMDGVLALTATPVTNSPLEIYSMLVLAHGEERLQQMLGGVKSSSGFLEAFCDITAKEFINIHNETVNKSAFVGLKNATLLRKIFADIATVKTAQDADVAELVKLPDVEEVSQNIEMTDDIKTILSEAIHANKSAKKELMDAKRSGSEVDKQTALEASAFHFINKVSRAVLDKDMYDEVTRYSFSPKDKTTAQTVIDEFNKKTYKEERTRPSPLTPDTAIIGSKQKTNADEEVEEIVIIHVTAWLDTAKDKQKGQIIIDTDEYDTQAKFLSICEKHKLELGVSLSPKLAALMANVNIERAHPKAAGGKCKQLIFCDLLGMHKKIKLALTQFAGIASSKISIMNAVEVDDAGMMQDIQDGFNADGDDNRFEIVIANKKAEVGINLQKGSQAVHHLTTGWTPDSLQQRNGRVVRQGNYVNSIAIYHYHANGTFDEYKQQLVSTKSDWIMDLLRGTGAKVEIAAGLSKEDMEVLAGFVGDDAAMAKAKTQMEAQKQASARKSTLTAIENNSKIFEVSSKESKKYATFDTYLLEKTLAAYKSKLALDFETSKLDKAQSKEKPDHTLINRIQTKIQSAQFIFDKQKSPVEASLGDTFESIVQNNIVGSGYGRNTEIQSKPYYLNQHYEARLKSDDIQQTALYLEWSDSVAQHEAIMADALKKSSQLGASVGLDSTAIKALFDGAAIRQNDTIVCKGTVFVAHTHDNTFYGVISQMDVAGSTIYAQTNSDKGGGSMRVSSFLEQCTALKPSDSEYDTAIDALTEYEQSRLAANGWADDSSRASICQLSADVTARLGHAVRTIINSSEYQIMDCAAPFLLYNGYAQSPLIESIKAEQALFGIEYVGANTTVNDMSSVCESTGNQSNAALIWPWLLDYAVSHKQTLSMTEVGAYDIVINLIGKDIVARTICQNAHHYNISLVGWDSSSQTAGIASYLPAWEQYCAHALQFMGHALVQHKVLEADVLEPFYRNLQYVVGAGIKAILIEFGFYEVIESKMNQQSSIKSSSIETGISKDAAGAAGTTSINEQIVYVYTVGNTQKLFNEPNPKIVGIRTLAQELGLEVGFESAKRANTDSVVRNKAKAFGAVPANAWIMDKRLWDNLLQNHAQQLNTAGITAHEVK